MMFQMLWDMMWFQRFRRNPEDYSIAFSPKCRRSSTKRHDVTS